MTPDTMRAVDKALRNLVAKIEKLTPGVNSMFQIAAIHGAKWPAGAENNWAAELAAAKSALAAAPPPTSQSLEAKCLGDLLAIIHGDGGHYQAKHGIEKATQDAIEKWYAKPPTSQWQHLPLQYTRERWAFDYDEKNSTFFVHSGGHRICDAEDSEVATAICAAFNSTLPAPPTEQDKP